MMIWEEKDLVICFPIRLTKEGKEVTLGWRKRKWRIGKLSGFGGRVEGDVSPLKTQLRELEEEAGIKARPENIIKQGEIEIFYPNPKKTYKLHIFTTGVWEGEFKETEEMKPQTFSLESIPYNRMISGDIFWAPAILHGHSIRAIMEKKNENTIVSFHFVRFS